MTRLSDRAFLILKTEIQRRTGSDAAGRVQQQILLRRLEKLRDQKGEPVGEAELREMVSDILPDFDAQVLQKAVRANRPPGPWGAIKVVAATVVGLAGGIYIINLPFPMVRIPIAKTAPILLLPSYISMDHSYRQAISLVEQADQLVNQATSGADIDLGGQKVKLAQKHLDALPVWFLGYTPQRYCSFFRCSWQFTFDEFQTARKQVGRMEAKVFQEKNALTQFQKASQELTGAKQKYQQATASGAKSDAIAQWQDAIDQMQQVPDSTLAGRMAKTQLTAAERDFEQATGYIAGDARTGNLIAAAKQFARNAAELGQNPPHSVAQWQEAVSLWEDAVNQLEQVPVTDPGFVASRSLLADYKKNLSTIRIRLNAEKESTAALEQAQEMTQSFLAAATAQAMVNNRPYLLSQLQGIINQLRKVQSGTTGYAEAQSLLKSAEDKLQQLQRL